MSINNYEMSLKNIKNKILENQFKYLNHVIIGDNSTGKSELLIKVLEQIKEEKNFYFIDSINRTINKDKINSSEIKQNSHVNVLRRRLEKELFNLEDSFDMYGDGIASIEQIYLNYKEKVNDLFNKFTGNKLILKESKDITGSIYKSLSIHVDNVGDENNEIEKISSGYQAIIRIILEICYFVDMAKDIQKQLYVVIDEINEFLSSKNEKLFVPFLLQEFPSLKFIITTHSPEVLSSLKDFNIIALISNKEDENNIGYECLDSNDYNTVTDAQELFLNIYNMNEAYSISDIESIARKLLNAKIYNTWNDEDERLLKYIKNKEEISISEQLLIRQIESW